MEKEFVMACILISLSTVLKIWSVIALYNLSITTEKEESMHAHHHIMIKKGQQVH